MLLAVADRQVDFKRALRVSTCLMAWSIFTVESREAAAMCLYGLDGMSLLVFSFWAELNIKPPAMSSLHKRFRGETVQQSQCLP